LASWAEIADEAPELAAAARELLDGRVHKTIATLRRDGSPRISGTEAFFQDGELWFGSMWRAVKALDLRRDPRFALHGGTVDPPDWSADAKLSGRAVEELDQDRVDAVLAARGGERPEGPLHLFRADVTDVVVTRLGGDPPDRLVIEFWREGKGVRRIERR
jgi:Pyridoxamine 5'-phosphate oxidase